MKRILYLILKNGQAALHVLDTIREDGWNGTIVETASLKHALEDRYEEHHFLSLQSWESMVNSGESTFSIYVVDEKDVERLKDLIRRETKEFQKVKGAMFSYPIDDFEGSF